MLHPHPPRVSPAPLSSTYGPTSTVCCLRPGLVPCRTAAISDSYTTRLGYKIPQHPHQNPSRTPRRQFPKIRSPKSPPLHRNKSSSPSTASSCSSDSAATGESPPSLFTPSELPHRVLPDAHPIFVVEPYSRLAPSNLCRRFAPLLPPSPARRRQSLVPTCHPSASPIPRDYAPPRPRRRAPVAVWLYTQALATDPRADRSNPIRAA